MKDDLKQLLLEKEFTISIRRLSTLIINKLLSIKIENDKMIYFKDSAKRIDEILKTSFKIFREVEKCSRERIRDINGEIYGEKI